MAYPKRLRGGYVSILMGNGASPEVFTVLCGLSTRSLTAQLNGNDEFIKDCADPEDIPVRAFLPTGRQWDVSGSGVIDRNSLQGVINAQGYTKNYRFVFGEPANDQVFSGYWAGPGVLTNLSFGGNDDAFATVDLTIVSDGLWEFVDTSGTTPTPPTLNSLTLSDTAFERGMPKTVNIVGATAGSSLSSGSLPSGFALNSGARTLAYDGTGAGAATPSITITETLAGATNSPRSSTASLTIADNSVPVNALTSPIDNELLLSPVDGQQLTYA